MTKVAQDAEAAMILAGLQGIGVSPHVRRLTLSGAPDVDVVGAFVVDVHDARA
jgi:hypothetical protein